ncbi:MAG: hypothetical protein U1G07_19615 [Verrucomicrobiota bacterium]
MVLATILLPALSRAKDRTLDRPLLEPQLADVLGLGGYTRTTIPIVLVGAAAGNTACDNTADWAAGSWLSGGRAHRRIELGTSKSIKRSLLWPYYSSSPEYGGVRAIEAWHQPGRITTAVRLRSFSINNWVGGDGWRGSGPWRPSDWSDGSGFISNKAI